jgi:hypothetical protein
MVERPLVIDSSSTLIEAARSAGPRGDYRCASATKLPLENASCDLVIAFMTLQRCRRTDRGRQRDGPRPCRQRDCLHRRCSSAELVGQVRERIARQLVCHRRELPRRVRLHRRHRAQWSTNDVSQQAPAARSLQPGAGSVGLRHRIHPRASDPRGSRQSRPVSTVAAHPVVPACARAQAGVDWSNIRHSVGSWYCTEPRLAFNRTVVLRYRIHLEQRGGSSCCGLLLPLFATAFPALPSLRTGGFRLVDERSARIVHDWDDINFSVVVVQRASGEFRAVDIDTEKRGRDWCRPPAAYAYVIPSVDSLRVASPT